MKHKLIFFYFTITSLISFGNNDSLNHIIITSDNVYTKVSAINELAYSLKDTDNESAIILVKKSIDLIENEIDVEKLNTASSIWINENAKIINLYGKSILKLGLLYRTQGLMVDALNNYFKALELFEKTQNNEEIASVLTYIGAIYRRQLSYEKALTYFQKSLVISKNINDKEGIASNYLSLGLVYWDLENFDLALDYYFKALEISKNIKNGAQVSKLYMNIGLVYFDKKNDEKALEFYFKSLKLSEKIGNIYNQGLVMGNIGNLYLEQNNHEKAKEFLEKSLQLFQELGAIDEQLRQEKRLYLLYEKSNDFKKAHFHYKNYRTLKDSITNNDNVRKQAQFEMQYEFDKKQTQIQAEIEKNELINQIEKKRNRLIIIFLIIGISIVLFFSIFIYKALNVSKKQKKIIEAKHKEITDSINYAERIQKCFLTSESLFKENLTDFFIYFKPKEVVSGDFYWAKTLNNNQFAVVVADSTGHGVPGAIMSLLNISSIEKSVEIETEPNKILDHTRSLIINRLKNDGSPDGGKDGMDCSLLILNKETNEIEFSLANNGLYIIREKELIEFKPDKIPVGKHETNNKTYNLHNFSVKKGDLIYMFTDGFADQFGGEKGKKFMYKPFKELLLKITSLPLAFQKNELDKAFKTWKGNLEQVDDVCVVGICV